ncbi:MAG: EF-P lysine aminoacylase EpmA [Gammaproteobacteria bacterium]
MRSRKLGKRAVRSESSLVTRDSSPAAADWRPVASLQTLRLRARLLQEIRQYFRRTGALEVETPLLVSTPVSDLHIDSFAIASHAADEHPGFLHTSPEYHMKRLLASGIGDIYQICKVFRVGESGRLHNPEFTLVEWYRLATDHLGLLDDVDALLRRLFSGRIELEVPSRMSYRDAFRNRTGLDPFAADTQELRNCAATFNAEPEGSGDLARADWLDLVFAAAVASGFSTDRLTYIYDYPVELAALARIRLDPAPAAERFEVFLGNVELGNGFHELTDVSEQRDRFERDRTARRERRRPTGHIDELFLDALHAGLPDCSGVALGLDRVLLLAGGTIDVAHTLAFPTARA